MLISITNINIFLEFIAVVGIFGPSLIVSQRLNKTVFCSVFLFIPYTYIICRLLIIVGCRLQKYDVMLYTYSLLFNFDIKICCSWRQFGPDSVYNRWSLRAIKQKWKIALKNLSFFRKFIIPKCQRSVFLLFFFLLFDKGFFLKSV